MIFGIIGLFIGPLSLVALYYAFKGGREVEEQGAEVGSSSRPGGSWPGWRWPCSSSRRHRIIVATTG